MAHIERQERDKLKSKKETLYDALKGALISDIEAEVFYLPLMRCSMSWSELTILLSH
jgi:hypothetical protein